MAAIEGMAAGIPIIVSDCRGTREYAVDKKTGYVCQAENDREFAVAIKKLYENREYVMEMGQYNAIRANQFGTAKVMSIMEKVYE